MTITFFGGAGGVTGSKHLLEAEGKRILLDCGTFQGLPDMRERNRGFPFPPDSIDAVILSHAHIDHCGMLPLLVKRGFTGTVYSTPATRDLAELMLLDMAKIEEQDAGYNQKHHVGAPDERTPLFSREDIPATMAAFKVVEYVRRGGEAQEIFPGVRLTFYDAGHILGSAISVLEIGGKHLAYTGDVGSRGMPLLFNPQTPREEVPTVIMESTYGSRTYEALPVAEERLAQAIIAVCARGGKMIVPAFALGRTQLFVYLLHKLTDEKKIPRFPIFVDSPLATNLTEVYRQHEQDYDVETIDDFGEDHTPLAFRNLQYTQSITESKALNGRSGPFMIISASGMMTAGRVVHHLRHSIEDPRNAIFITGYQAQGTLGRRILEGVRQVEIRGGQFEVAAQVYLFNEFSAHADRRQLQELAESIVGLQRLILVHGEPHQADDFKQQLQQAHPDWEILRPGEGDSITF